jgi:hypothetical protein
MRDFWKDLSFSKPQKAILFVFAFLNAIASIYEAEENDGNMLWYYMLAAFISLLLAFKKKEA